jgi:hypothetical protein
MAYPAGLRVLPALYCLLDSHSLLSSPLCLHLYLPHRHHLLSQVILVFPNAAVPPSDCLVLADHDVFGNLVQ